MSQRTSPLDYVTVAAPCNAGWENMTGNERVRFCGQCSLNVYNLTAMTKREAEQLILQAEGRLCVRFYRRADGTILTKNCPVGLRALKRRVKRIAGASVSAVLSFFAGLLAAAGFRESTPAPAVIKSPAVEIKETLPNPAPMMGTFAASEELGRSTIPVTGEYVDGRVVMGDWRPAVKPMKNRSARGR